MQFVNTLAEVLEAIKAHEGEHNLSFVCIRSEANFSATTPPEVTSNSHLNWSLPGDNPIKFTGKPFLLVGSRIYHCAQGSDNNLTKKRQYAAERDQKIVEGLHPGTKLRQTGTKKNNCPAKFTVKRIFQIDGFDVQEDTRRAKDTAGKQLRRRLAAGATITGRDLFVFAIPEVDRHANHSDEQCAKRKRLGRSKSKDNVENEESVRNLQADLFEILYETDFNNYGELVEMGDAENGDHREAFVISEVREVSTSKTLPLASRCPANQKKFIQKARSHINAIQSMLPHVPERKYATYVMALSKLVADLRNDISNSSVVPEEMNLQ